MSGRQWLPRWGGMGATAVLFCLICLTSKPLTAQNQEREVIEREIENALERQSDEEDETELLELLEDLERLRYQPLDLNLATAGELAMVPGLTFRIAQHIVRFRDENGKFGPVEELLQVQGIGPVTLEKARPFLTTATDRTSQTRRLFQPDFWTMDGKLESFSRFRQVMQPQAGYQRADTLGGYVGSPAHLYQRIRYQSRHLSVNTTLSKSPGEPYQHPLDFASASRHLALRELGSVESVIIGDYTASFGQGLLLWNGGAFGKTGHVIRGAVKHERGIRPSSSSRPVSGFRGVAISAAVTKHLRFSGFYSVKKRSSTLADHPKVNPPSATGRYRTLNELSRKHNLSQETIGGRLILNFSSASFGFTAYRNRFDKEIAAGSQPYQRYNFSGQQLSGLSSDYRYNFRNIHLFGEMALSDNKGVALLSGADVQLSETTAMILLVRDYGKKFQSLFGSGFGEQSGRPRNERGIYMGIRHRLTSRIGLNLYMDQFHFPGPGFQAGQPTSGYDWLVHLEYTHSRELQLYLMTRFKQRETEYRGADPFGREVRQIQNRGRFNIRLHLEYRVHPKARLRFRTDYVRVEPSASGASTGLLLYSDLRVEPLRRLRVDLRVTVFDTDDYDSRVFQFENDLLYVMTNKMLQNRGQRTYLNLHYQITGKVDLWFKISSTLYENKNEIGSGLDLILNNRRSEIGFQARIRL